MVILILERVPASLRGELTRYMIEPRVGVFVGVTSALVRDKLWERAQKNARGGAGVLIYRARTEQGFRVQTFGDPSREPVDYEGLMLVRKPRRDFPPGGLPVAAETAEPLEDPPPPDTQ